MSGRGNSLDVTVLMGGPSNEREVSLMSGRAVADALARAGHAVTCADISPSDPSALDRPGIEVVFIALHGRFGESGEVQELCEQRQLRYVGSAQRASELAMDKAAAKQIFRRAGLVTPDWMILEDYHSPDEIANWLTELQLPVVVKPVDDGSSIDITIAADAASRDAAIDAMIDNDGRAMVEAFVSGRELTVGIIGEQTLPLIEIVPARPFYDFDAKYADDTETQFIFDHGLDAAIVEAANDAALTAHRVLNCRDMSRVDFLLDENGNFQVLEVNTIPGFTGHSLLPMAAAKAGIGFDELVDRLVRMADARRVLETNNK